MRKGQISIEVVFILMIVLTLSAAILAQFLTQTQKPVIGAATARETIITELSKLDGKYYLQNIEVFKTETGLTINVITNPPLTALTPIELNTIIDRVKEEVEKTTGVAQNNIKITYTP